MEKNSHLLIDVLKKTGRNTDNTVIHAIYPVAFLSICNPKINKMKKKGGGGGISFFYPQYSLKIPADTFLVKQ